MDNRQLARFGTNEAASAARKFSAGPLSLVFSDGAVRRLSWHGIEIIRGISCPIRDENWATHGSTLVDERIAETPDAFEISQTRMVGEGALRVTLNFQGRADGHFRATAELFSPREFLTNRAGFTVLHPLRGVAGTPMQVRHPDGSSSPRIFPALISPDQPAADMAGIRQSVDGIEVEIAFRGEVFEMEDQRNWTDASFKTYCRPLALPRPYRLHAGETQRQEIDITLQGVPAQAATQAGTTPVLAPGNAAGTVPQIAFAIDDSKPVPHEIVRQLNPGILQLRVRPDTAAALCAGTSAILAAHPAEVELEVVIPATDDPETALARVAAECKKASLTVTRVLALPEPYLLSHQPSGPWPSGPAPQDLWPHVRTAFPQAGIGGGVLTYFTELNRCRPPASGCDYIAHGSTAITHAADDASVLESLEGLAHVLGSARAIAQQRDYRLGLVAIGMRTNPYGAGVVENTCQNRIAMAGADPRQRGLFAAAWAVGAAAATQGYDVSSMALSTFTGAFGIVHRRQSWPQPLYDDSDEAELVYPLFHVVRFLSAMGGAERLTIPDLGNGIAGVAAKATSGVQLVLANLGVNQAELRLPRAAQVLLLNGESFSAAIRDPLWLDTSPAQQASEITLAPLDVAFLSL